MTLRRVSVLRAPGRRAVSRRERQPYGAEILNHLLVGAKARGKEADDFDGRVGMLPQTIE